MFERHGRTPKTNTFTKHAGLLEVSQGSRPTFALLVCSTYVSPGCQRFWLPTPFCGLQANSLFANSGAQECSIKTFAMRPAMEWALINLHGDSSLEPCLKGMNAMGVFFGKVGQGGWLALEGAGNTRSGGASLEGDTCQEDKRVGLKRELAVFFHKQKAHKLRRNALEAQYAGPMLGSPSTLAGSPFQPCPLVGSIYQRFNTSNKG